VTDNLFDRLADLFRGSGPVNWRLAREIAESVAGPAEPNDPWTDEQLRDLAATAQRLVSAVSPLDALAAADDIRVLDRRQWAAAGVTGLEYLAEPMAERFADLGGALAPQLQPLGPALLGMQIGALIGITSHRVVGHADLGISCVEPAQIAFVARNIADLSTEQALDPRQVQMWAALREVTHHAVFAVPWMREHLHMLGHAHAEEFEIDHESMAERLRLLQDPEAMRGLMEGGEEGLADLAPPITPGDPARGIDALTSFVDGYADHMVERAGSDYLPDLADIREGALQRREAAAPGEAALYHSLALDPDPDGPRRGAAFCGDVSRRWGVEALDRVWEGPEMLPSDTELTDPTGWAARVLL
jgi:putative hydrolase